jgi:hypothetical protein
MPINLDDEDRVLVFVCAIIIAILVIVAVVWVNIDNDRKGDRGRGDAPVAQVNEGKMDAAFEMGDLYLNVGHKCVGFTGYIASTRGDGDAGSIAQPTFMDPFCLGVYDASGKVDDARMSNYVKYQAAIQSGDGERAAALADQLIASAPRELVEPDPLRKK